MTDLKNDRVVFEAPVMLSTSLAKKLYLYQYPVRPKHLKYDELPIVRSKIKPHHQEVELELQLNTRSPNYDVGKGEQIVLNCSSAKGQPESSEYESGMMDKHILRSGPRVVENACSYCIGVFQDGELLVTPIRGIVQLQPSFPYLDADRQPKEDAKEVEDENAEEDAQKINVKFARQESDRFKKAREMSFGFLNKKRAEEQWFSTNFYNSQSEEAEQERLKLLSFSTQNEVTGLDIEKTDYMKNLVPPESSDYYSSPSSTMDLISLDKMKALTMGDQVKMLLRSAKIIGFGKLLALLNQEKEAVNVLRFLQAVAVLINGNWVVKSDVLYPKDSESSFNGVPADLMCRARDYMLSLFTKNKYLDRSEIAATVKLPLAEVTEILSHVSQYKAGKGWELLLPCDEEFIKRYPEVVQRQSLWWEAKQRQLSQLMSE
ncbi:DNA-directed RNA polymerase III subunit RPC5-like [Ischnura elegans]|uniref:DNA-directed RNA polymerase III subunit RPC5-like n=1 Tax=Ischnura elegans TaxID=197161 RepID=UPI001ED89125|nr:DNA-directed RNA polymerase III subunit RPC5-like [Ischnura elegans]